jgi:hypothetical protein
MFNTHRWSYELLHTCAHPLSSTIFLVNVYYSYKRKCRQFHLHVLSHLTPSIHPSIYSDNFILSYYILQLTLLPFSFVFIFSSLFFVFILFFLKYTPLISTINFAPFIGSNLNPDTSTNIH